MTVGVLLYILVITVQQPQADLPGVVLAVAKVLDSSSANVTILQAVKVSGESDFVAVVEAQTNSGLEHLVGSLWQLGNVIVRSRPVIDGNTFARNLGVRENLTTSNNTLQKERLFFEEINVAQKGISTEELLDITRQQIELLLTLKSRGELSIVLYKAFERSTIYTFVNIPDVPEYELQLNYFPLRLEIGANVDVSVAGVQLVDEYIASSEV